MRGIIHTEISESNEDYEHELNNNIDLIYNFVNMYFLSEQNYFILCSPYFFDIYENSSSKFYRCSSLIRIIF